MTDDRDIRDLLDDTAPDAPDLTPTDRVEAVTSRSRAVTRRHRVLVGAAAAVAVVAVGVSVPLLAGDDNGSAPVANDPSDGARTAPVECPDEPVDIGTGIAADALPDGATSARLCPATSSGATPLDGEPALPDQPLVDGVDTFTQAVRDLPAYDLEPRCAAILLAPAPWSLVVGYPDGSTVTVGTGTRTCAAVMVEGVDRSAERVLALFHAEVQPQKG